MVQFKKQLVSRSVENQRSYGRGNPVNNIVMHQTGNTDRGANAEMHARLQSRLNPRQASWHEQVDDKQAIQSFDDSVQCWAAGDGRGPGNTTGYHIEICINSDGDYKKAVENGAKRAAAKLKEHKLGINRLKQHADFANKNCPAQIRSGKDGITWTAFKNMVIGYMDTDAPAPPKQQDNKGVKWIGTDQKGKRVESIWDGRVNFYDSARWTNPSGSFGKGEGWIIDNKYMVDGYPQWRVQNSRGDLYFITANEKYVRVVGSKPAQPKKSISAMATEVLAGKHGNGHAARQRSLGVDNATYQKVRAEVNRRS